MINEKPSALDECAWDYLRLLRITLESIRSDVEVVLPPHVDDALIDRVAERAAKLISTAYEKDSFALLGKRPSVLIASAIYLSGRMDEDVKITQIKIAEELNVTEVTIRLRAKALDEILGLDFGSFYPFGVRDKYLCPFCEEAFKVLRILIFHLREGGIKFAFDLSVSMFNDDGILVDEEMLEKMNRDTATCKRTLDA